MPSDWRRYLAPAAFLLAVTVAVVLVRSGLESGHSAPDTAAGVTTTATPPPPKQTTTTVAAKTTTTQAKAYWTVKAGDTFAVIATQSGVTVATIEQLNPTAKSTSLYIGQKIRIR